MSLLNDALKQASAKTQSSAAAPANGPALRPTPPIASRRNAGNDFLLPALVVVILLLAAILLWQWFRSGKNQLQVRARTIPAAEVAQPAPIAQSAVTAPTLVTTSQVANIATPNPASSIQQQVSSIPHPASTNEQPAPTIALPVTNAPPPPPSYKLQSIFYRAKSPCAVINGKMLFIGDRIGHSAHLIAITQESATIVTTNGETKILELP